MIDVGRVAMISIKNVVVGERARKEMGDLDGLESSLKESGLIQPLAVRKNDDGKYELIAGGRRLELLKRNNVQTIPVRIFEKETSLLDIKIAEKSENLYRKEMEYWEMDKLTAEIHKLQQEKHGVKPSGPSSEGWGVRDTSAALGKSPAAVVESIKRNEAREQFPEFFSECKTASDASKKIRQLDKTIQEKKAAEEFSKRADSIAKALADSFKINNVFKAIATIPNKTYDLIEIDPPYSMKGELKDMKYIKSSAACDKLSAYNDVSNSIYMNGSKSPDDKWGGINALFQHCYRVLKDDSWLLCWFAPEPWFCDFYNSLTSAGFEVSRICAIWNKGWGQTMQPNYNLANSYEMFFYAKKGKPTLYTPGRPNIFTQAPTHPSRKRHPTERPVELMEQIFNVFTKPLSKILVPFLGSGNSLIAAYNLKMKAEGYELSENYKNSFLAHLNELDGFKEPRNDG